MLEVRIGLIEVVDPRREDGDDFVLCQIREPPFGLIADVSPVGFELFAQFCDGHFRQIGSFRERTVFSGYSPDTAVGFITIGVPKRRLVVANNRIKPVGDVDRSVRADADINRTKGVV